MNTAIATNPLAQEEQTTNHRHRPTATVTSLPTLEMRPPRLNFAEHCLLCFGFRCESAFCIEHYEQSRWEICRYCDGSGFDAFAEQICNCAGGLVDMTHSEWPNEPRHRPPRLNLAGYCEWCMRRWCNNQRCIDRHLASEWMVCDRCEGTANDELSHTPCGCESGLVEAGHR